MPEPTLITVTVTVTFTAPDHFTYTPSPADGVTFGGTPTAHASLSGPNNWAFIYQLAGDGVGDTLIWDTNPFIWGESGPPPPVESGLTLPTPSANQIVLGVHNDNTSESAETFGFRLRLLHHEQQVESPDPEIILDPP